jgi:hypothetical protein
MAIADPNDKAVKMMLHRFLMPVKRNEKDRKAIEKKQKMAISRDTVNQRGEAAFRN